MDANECWILMKCSDCCGLARAFRLRAEKSRNPAKITNSRCTAADFGGHRCVKLSVNKGFGIIRTELCGVCTLIKKCKNICLHSQQ